MNISRTYIKTLIVINILIAISILLSEVKAQSNRKLPPGVTVKTTRRGDNSSTLQPSEDSERIKYKIEVKNDSLFFSLKAERFDKGIHNITEEESLFENIESKIAFKGDKIFFEMVPDISKSSKLILFANFPYMTKYRYLNCDGDKQHIKYKKFKEVNLSQSGVRPLMICYVDDENNNTEKFLNKYVKDNLLTITSMKEIHEKILQHIEKCILVYYSLTEK
jgi:hypothetical protein